MFQLIIEGQNLTVNCQNLLVLILNEFIDGIVEFKDNPLRLRRGLTTEF